MPAAASSPALPNPLVPPLPLLLLPPPDALSAGTGAKAPPKAAPELLEPQLLVARIVAPASAQTTSHGARALLGPSWHALNLRETVFLAGISESLPLSRSG